MPTKKDRRKAAACYYYLAVKSRCTEKKRSHRYWVRDWIKRRENMNIMEILLKELEQEDEVCYKNFLRMSAADFRYLLDKIKFVIEKQNTHMRNSIPAAERLAITLRFLATGDSYHSLMYLFRIPVCTISRIIPEVCSAIYNVLKEEYLQVPSSEQEWLQIARQFEEKWNFPQCIGALDGKHVAIKAPKHSGSLFYNYKGTHSIVLMALADANYKFLYINVGSMGRISDGGVFNTCSLATKLENNSLNIPKPRPLPGRNKAIPFVIVADDAFAMKPYIMKPYAFRNLHGGQRVFNYRLSRARRIIENCFGIASARFRVLRKPIELEPEKVSIIVSAICVLHNFLMTRSQNLYAPNGTFDIENHENGTIQPGEWRQETKALLPLQLNRNLRGNLYTKEVQKELTKYFQEEGEVPWQYEYI
ncbi:putative nuclease HARBI1 [Sitophilus oryzae]|uniref:Nuclease HARBI1 n=1 Tax=Sitophilus oryzae TaxID=7048 RepID=A0A6J2XID2_SITOR|nr:putative nuclease HARBI1 [Sitophilus oryzae]